MLHNDEQVEMPFSNSRPNKDLLNAEKLQSKVQIISMPASMKTILIGWYRQLFLASHIDSFDVAWCVHQTYQTTGHLLPRDSINPDVARVG